MTRHLLIIGGQRCGTTLLYELLDAHPDIAMARPMRPEPKVFMSDELASRGLDWYRATYFAHVTTESVLGEKSTSYIEDPAAAARAARVLGDADIVVQLRDPIARAISNWRFSSAHGAEQRPLALALEENLAGPRAWDPDKTSVSPYAYLERGRYAEHLSPWYQSFPGSVHVQFLADAAAGPPVVAELYRELGVDPSFRPPDAGRRVNQSTGTKPRLDDELVQRLREYFRLSDEHLADLLGRRLPWMGPG